MIFKPRVPKNKFRRFFYRWVTSNYFDIAITVVILLNTLIMALRHARMSDSYELTIEIFNYFFTLLYNIELVFKLIGIGRRYFGGWDLNLFDFIWVLASDIALILSFFVSNTFQSLVIFARAFRIIKILRIFDSFGKVFITTLTYAIPQMRNVLLLLILLLFIFATLGINLFSTVMYKDHYNTQNNFRNIFDALVLLMRCATGEEWNLIMYNLAKSDPFNGEECIDDQTYEEMQRDGIKGCGTSIAFLYFISFFIIMSLVIMDLSIGVFIDSLQAATNDENGVVKRDQISDVFLKLWSDYDPNATGWIHVDQLWFL